MYINNEKIFCQITEVYFDELESTVNRNIAGKRLFFILATLFACSVSSGKRFRRLDGWQALDAYLLEIYLL